MDQKSSRLFDRTKDISLLIAAVTAVINFIPEIYTKWDDLLSRREVAYNTVSKLHVIDLGSAGGLMRRYHVGFDVATTNESSHELTVSYAAMHVFLGREHQNSPNAATLLDSPPGIGPDDENPDPVQAASDASAAFDWSFIGCQTSIEQTLYDRFNAQPPVSDPIGEAAVYKKIIEFLNRTCNKVRQKSASPRSIGTYALSEVEPGGMLTGIFSPKTVTGDRRDFFLVATPGDVVAVSYVFGLNGSMRGASNLVDIEEKHCVLTKSDSSGKVDCG